MFNAYKCAEYILVGQDSRKHSLVSPTKLSQDSGIPRQPPTHLVTFSAPGCLGTRSTAQDLSEHRVPAGEITDVTYLKYIREKKSNKGQ